MSDSHSFVRASHRGGFSLLELLVVVTIIAAVSGLVVAKLDWAKRSADSATSLAGMSDVQDNLQIYRTVKGTYPDRFDSLLAAPAVVGGQPTAKYAKIWAHATPTFEVTTIPAASAFAAPSGVVFSLQHAGLTTILDHSATASFPGDSGTVIRTLDYLVDTALYTVVANSRIEKAIYPGGKPTNVTLVALGVGPGCTVNGITMASPPVCSAIDPVVYYPRFTAIFAAYADGTRAELKTVVDSVGQTATAQIKNFYTNTPQ